MSLSVELSKVSVMAKSGIVSVDLCKDFPGAFFKEKSDDLRRERQGGHQIQEGSYVETPVPSDRSF